MSMFYSPSELIKNAWSYLCTKLFFPTARLIRRPIYLRGRKGLSFGKGFTCGYRCRLEMFHADEGVRLLIGTNCKIGDEVHIVASQKVSIGNDCLFASHIFVSDTNHGSIDMNPMVPPDERPITSNPVIIGDRVWLGEGVCVLPGAKIGNGCIIGAHAVVNGEIPDNCVAVGAPAHVIKRYNFETKKMERWKE